MNHVKIGALSGCWLLCSTLLLGCITDTVPPDIYSTGQSYEPAVADGPGSDMDRPDMPENPDSPDSPDPLEPPVSDMPARDASIGSDPPSEGCDLSGEWLVTERNVASGLGVKQAGVTWFYYEIEQSGNQLQVKRGLVCGSQVKPVDAVSAAVNYSAAWPKMQGHRIKNLIISIT